MTDLHLDPDDGRETGLHLKRHTIKAYEEQVPTNPVGRELDEAIRRMFDSYTAQVAAKAEELAAHGLALEEVQVGPDSDWTGTAPTVRMLGTYRIVPLQPAKERP